MFVLEDPNSNYQKLRLWKQEMLKVIAPPSLRIPDICVDLCEVRSWLSLQQVCFDHGSKKMSCEVAKIILQILML